MSSNKQNNNWDSEVDVIVVGLGGAGACAALEAAENGANVMIVERFNGGGATNASGGVVYSGGGTKYQKQAGFDDTPENMFNYLKHEVKDVVEDSTLKAFCDQSADNLTWLERHGVPFEASLCPFKTSFPSDKYYLYYSGNESYAPFNEDSTPAPRGHRSRAKGISGKALFGPLKEAIVKKGINIRTQSKVTKLITDNDGNVIGVECSEIKKGSFKSKLYRFMTSASYTLRYIMFSYPPLAKYFANAFKSIEKNGQTYRVHAKKGVILSAGGFVFNRQMISQYAPTYRKGVGLGTFGDDGSGIKLGEETGGAISGMDRVSAWRFINPPEAFVKGVLVDLKGERICNEMLYGAQVGELIVDNHRDEGLLVIDSKIWKQSHRDILPDKAKMFQAMCGLLNLYINRKKGNSFKELAAKCGIDEAGFTATMEAYNQMAQNTKKDPMGKLEGFVQPVLTPPFYAIDCSLGAKGFTCPNITLGGLVVDGETGEVKKEDGAVINGLYAAGRCAVGITSRGYVSGLSIADAIFSGRRAGRHASEQ